MSGHIFGSLLKMQDKQFPITGTGTILNNLSHIFIKHYNHRPKHSALESVPTSKKGGHYVTKIDKRKHGFIRNKYNAFAFYVRDAFLKTRQVLKHMRFLPNFLGFILFQTLCIK
jgi:hypothetical protein